MSWESKLLARAGWISLALGAAVVANVLLYVFGVANLDKLTRSLKERSQAGAEQIAKAEAQAKVLRTDVGRIAASRSFMDQLALETLKTRPERIVTIQDEMSRLISESGLAADRVGYSYEILPEKADTTRWKHRYLKMTLQVGVSGSYPQVKSFIVALQDSPQFFVLENMAVNTTTQGTVVLHANMLVSTYFIATETDRAQ